MGCLKSIIKLVILIFAIIGFTTVFNVDWGRVYDTFIKPAYTQDLKPTS